MSRTDRLHTTETNHMTTSTRKAPQTMGASRDYTAANDQHWVRPRPWSKTVASPRAAHPRSAGVAARVPCASSAE